jgi:2,4-dienoyl-CoA reductase-like NADH-dependent reductase (Old Yellow Enzyme family)
VALSILTAQIKKAVSIPIIAGGVIIILKAEEILSSEEADLIWVGRGMLQTF